MFLQISFILQKANSSILFPLHSPSQKLKGRRIKRKKKDRKKERKRERISFNFFSCSSPSSPQKRRKEGRDNGIFILHFLLLNKKKERKEERKRRKNGRKETKRKKKRIKRRRKEVFSRSLTPSRRTKRIQKK